MIAFSCLAGCSAHTAGCCSELPAEAEWGTGCSALLLLPTRSSALPEEVRQEAILLSCFFGKLFCGNDLLMKQIVKALH